MKIVVKKTQFATYSIDEVSSLVEQDWTNNEDKMLLDDYKTEMFNYLKFVEQYKTRNALINLSSFNFPITPEVQKWVDENIAVVSNKIVKKIAFIVPNDIIVQLSVEQTMEEKEGSEYEFVGYFENTDKAMTWLNQK